MKTYNEKQQAWSENKVYYTRQRLTRLFIFFVLTIILVCTAAIILTNKDNHSMDNILDTVEIPTCLATVMGVVGNIKDPANSEKVGRQAKAKLWILSEDQWDDSQAFPSRSGREVGNIPLKNGETWHYIESVLDSPEPKWTAETGDVASTITNSLPFIVGGMGDAVLDLLETGLNKGFFVVWEICSTGNRYLGGNGCKPLKLVSFDGGATKDNTSTTITFENQCGETWSRYVGNTPTEEPEVVAADAESITLTSNPRYQLTDGTSSVADITTVTGTADSDIGRVITILGSGGTWAPTISSGGDFLLITGEQWQGNKNSQISFKIFKDGETSYKLMEIAGTRT